MTNRTPKIFTVAIIATLALSAIAGTLSVTTVQAEQSNEISQAISDNAAESTLKQIEQGNDNAALAHDTQTNVFSDRANDVGDGDNGGFDDRGNDNGNHYGNEAVDDDYSDTGNNGGAEDNGSGNDD